MGIALWVAQILLAAFNGFAGVLKSTQPIDRLTAMMKWPGDFPAWFTRFIAVAELAAAIGLILPAATGILPWLTPLAALGVAIIQVAAIVLHARRGETAQSLPINLIVLALAIFVIWGRWGSFTGGAA